MLVFNPEGMAAVVPSYEVERAATEPSTGGQSFKSALFAQSIFQRRMLSKIALICYIK